MKIRKIEITDFAALIGSMALGGGFADYFFSKYQFLGVVLGAFFYFGLLMWKSYCISPNVSNIISPKPEISDKTREYLEIASLVCLDLDVLFEISRNKDLSADQLRNQIEGTVKKVKEIQSNPQLRRIRYNSGCTVLHFR